MVATHSEFHMAPSVTRALRALRRYNIDPDQIDRTILNAINATLCLASNGNDRVAEGFNHDIAVSGRAFGRHLVGRVFSLGAAA
jgi:hypothetical protein